VTSPAKSGRPGRRPLVYALERVGADTVSGSRAAAVLRLRPAARLQDHPAHPGPARAGRRPQRPPGTRRPPARRRLHGDQRAGRDEPGDPIGRRLHGLGPMVAITGQCRQPDRTDGFQRPHSGSRPDPKHNFLVTSRRTSPAPRRAFHVPRPGGPGRCCGHRQGRDAGHWPALSCAGSPRLDPHRRRSQTGRPGTR